MDEDSITGTISQPLARASDIPSYVFTAYFAMTQPGTVDPEIRAGSEDERDDYVERVVQSEVPAPFFRAGHEGGDAPRDLRNVSGSSYPPCGWPPSPAMPPT